MYDFDNAFLQVTLVIIFLTVVLTLLAVFGLPHLWHFIKPIIYEIVKP